MKTKHAVFEEKLISFIQFHIYFSFLVEAAFLSFDEEADLAVFGFLKSFRFLVDAPLLDLAFDGDLALDATQTSDVVNALFSRAETFLAE